MLVNLTDIFSSEHKVEQKELVLDMDAIMIGGVSYDILTKEPVVLDVNGNPIENDVEKAKEEVMKNISTEDKKEEKVENVEEKTEEQPAEKPKKTRKTKTK